VSYTAPQAQNKNKQTNHQNFVKEERARGGHDDMIFVE
jgi:hypothetical protein